MDFLYILLAIGILLLMIVIHEFGHYLAGKLLKFKINEFAVGFGPKILSKRLKNGELFTLRAFPLGGYCAFLGEDEIVSGGTNIVQKNIESESKSDLMPFNAQAPWKRIVVLLSGAFMNLVSAVLFSILFIAIVGYNVPRVDYTFATTNAAVFQKGDVLTAVNGKEVGIMNSFDELMAKIEQNQTVTLSIERGGQPKQIEVVKQLYRYVYVNEHKDIVDAQASKLRQYDTILEFSGTVLDVEHSFESMAASLNASGQSALLKVLRYDAEQQQFNEIFITLTYEDYTSTYKDLIVERKQAGLGISTQRIYINGDVLYAVGYSVPFTMKMSWTILDFFGKLITGKIQIIGAISGPVTTVTTIAEVTQASALNILVLLPLIAANLAVFNLLPIPALDGSKVIFCLVEWIRKKPINRNVEAWIHFGGLVFILGLVLFVEFFTLLGS